jgi:hypothetical protein
MAMPGLAGRPPTGFSVDIQDGEGTLLTTEQGGAVGGRSWSTSPSAAAAAATS